MGFNKEQESAIFAPITENVLVAAGAGSGKTRTLAEKVFTIIDKGEVKPSELLVLTFTDNAAHEMRERIIQTFKDRGQEEIAEQVASAHIRTFDSFARYLVSAYADVLGISSNVNLANSDVISAKKSVYLDDIFNEYYNDEAKYQRLVKTLVKFNIAGDRNTKKVIQDLYKQLDKLTLEKKDEILNDYENKFLSDTFFKDVVGELVRASKNIISNTIKEAYFVEKHFDVIEGDNPELIANLFNDKSAFNIDINLCNFYNTELNQEMYRRLKDTLISEGGEFVKKIHEFANDKSFKFSTSEKNPSGDEKDKAVFDILKGVTKKLDAVMTISDLDEEINKLKSFKEDIALLLEIVKELNKRIDDYKAITNSFEFNDILLKAVSLLTNPKYEKSAEKIRKQFKFIMVDEYQDTNDFQEAIINSLIAPKEDGTSAHLFCVGDAKQAIYAFRNSKVELFTKRQEQYSSGPGHRVILMHKNYRSGKGLLNEINHIIKFYMTLSHGGIDYAFANEGLEYDDKFGPYSKLPYEHFGVSRITSISGRSNDSFDDPKKWEAMAIASDIKNKIENHFKVYKRTPDGGKLEDCTYDDFVIIMRTTKGFEDYQEVFKDAHIPLNNKLKSDLKEINAILLLQSLTELIVNEICPELHSEKAFLFASVARSYIYQYDDQTIFEILKDHDESRLDDDQIMQDVHEFIAENQDVSAYEFFVNMINFFSIVEKLYLVGDVEDNISKIESLGAILSSQEKMGDTLVDFVKFLNDITDYSLGLGSDTTVKTTNAVDMMTIHASKGLEEKIVYLPVSYNQLSQGNNADKADYLFDERFGIILPYYNYDENDTNKDGNIKDVLFETLPSILLKNSDKDPERDEHVRLFYVALTRAENIVYIVGDKPDGDNKKKENLYGMLSYLPHYQRIDEEYIAKKIKDKQVDASKYQNYLKTIEVIKSIDLMSSEGIDADLYSKLFNKYYTDKLTGILDAQIEDLFKPLFREYYLRYVNMTRDPNMDATVFAYYRYNEDITSSEELEEIVRKDANGSVDLQATLNEFINAVSSGDYTYFVSLTAAKQLEKKTEDNIPYGLFDILMPVFVRVFDDQKRFIYESYENKDYKDEVTTFDYDDFEYDIDEEDAEEVIGKIDQLPVDDSIITFPTIVKERASKQRHYDESLEDAIPDQVLSRGVYLHRLMELVDFVSKDTSFIKNEKDRKLIDKVLSNPVFDDLSNAKIYKEYGYFDEAMQTTGFIDLLYFKDDECYIVDYKSRSIDDEAYERQLRVYQRNVQYLFNINKEHMHLYLLSLSENRIKEVKPE
ncbi:MAG: UvrD-helicase domain-containing protein [Bacilli bacterium]|nr:UvrD-helicase domain-containing protein [Bacilli bacterium]